MMDKKEIGSHLTLLSEEIMAKGAWSGHAYAFEYLGGDYLGKLVSAMKENGVPSKTLEQAFSDAGNEYDRIRSDGNMPALTNSDMLKLEKADNLCVEEMLNAMGRLAQAAGIAC